jgi:hypothetical protein
MTGNGKWIGKRILTGLVVSTEYLQQINSFWNVKMLSAPTAKLIATWRMDYFNQYQKAPNRDIENIFMRQKRKGLSKEKAEWIINRLV